MTDLAAALYPGTANRPTRAVAVDAYDKTKIKAVARDPQAALSDFYMFVFELARVE